MQKEMLHALIEQVKDNEVKDEDKDKQDYEYRLLLAGLTVLAKDVAEYLAATGHFGGDASLFQEVYTISLDSEREYWQKHGPGLFLPLQEARLPSGFAAGAAAGKLDLDLTPLSNANIIHDWTRYPGRDLLQQFAIKFKETICGKDGPYEKFQDGLIGQSDLPLVIASTILTVGFSTATFWYPLAAYIGFLLTKAVLKTYCETGVIELIKPKNQQDSLDASNESISS
jgi:hypothetical protein